MRYFRKITGESVYLSPYNPDDVEVFTKWLNDPAVSDGLGDTVNQYNLVSEKKWLDDVLSKGEQMFTIVSVQSDEPIGSIGLFEIKQIHRTATVGLFIGDEENRGKGLGTEALQLMVRYGFDSLNLNNINLNVFSFNERAVKSYIKVGFKEYGRRRQSHYMNNVYYDTICMDIIREDYYKDVLCALKG